LNVLSNLALSCATCNFAKGLDTAAVDAGTGMMTSLFNPRLQKWDEHFEWSKDFSTIAGKTAVGRVTVIVLNMNNSRRLNARPLWLLTGKWPG
jgi:hypothetical protein